MLIHTVLIGRYHVHMDVLIFLSRIGAFIETQGKSGRDEMLLPAEEFNARMASFNNPSIGFFRQSNIMLVPFDKINSMKLIEKDSPDNFSKLQILFTGQIENTLDVPQGNN